MIEVRHSDRGTCLQCGKTTEFWFRPFCSRRYSHLDLSNWLGEECHVAAVEPAGDFLKMLEHAEE